MVEVDDVVGSGLGDEQIPQELRAGAPRPRSALGNLLGERHELGPPAEPLELRRQLEKGLRPAERAVERWRTDEEDPHRAVRAAVTARSGPGVDREPDR